MSLMAAEDRPAHQFTARFAGGAKRVKIPGHMHMRRTCHMPHRFSRGKLSPEMYGQTVRDPRRTFVVIFGPLLRFGWRVLVFCSYGPMVSERRRDKR